MIDVRELHDIHTGRPAAVLGGGPQKAADIANVPADAVRIGVNHHGMEIGWRVDYLVFMDDPRRFQVLELAIRSCAGIVVSWRKDWSDVDLAGVRWWNGRFSSHLATWLACWMGCAPVLLCGMDCFQTRPLESTDSAYNIPLQQHLDEWHQAFERCQNPGVIRVVSGPLVTVFGKQGE